MMWLKVTTTMDDIFLVRPSHNHRKDMDTIAQIMLADYPDAVVSRIDLAFSN